MSFHCDEEEKRRQASQRLAAISHVIVEFTAPRLEYFLLQHSRKLYPDTDSPAHPFQLVV